MARPIKQGLDYFPFDVDFFNDEKIFAIAGEFGIKGEITTVKLLCAVYRNGYYIEWTEMLKYKLLKELPGVSADLLDQIIKRLVKWDFFDKGLFDSASILTSIGIQRRYQTISTKTHRKNNISEYSLINTSQPAPMQETPYPRKPKPTKQAPPPAGIPQPVPLKESIATMLSDTDWNETVCTRFNITKESFEARLQDFRQYCLCMDKRSHEDISDAKRHFCSWLKSEKSKNKIPSVPKAPETQRRKKSDSETPEEIRFRKLIPANAGQLIMSFAQYQALGLDRMTDEQIRKYCAEVIAGQRTIPSILDLLKK